MTLSPLPFLATPSVARKVAPRHKSRRLHSHALTSFLITEKTQVNGDDAHLIIKAAKEKFPGEIEWNFDGRHVFDRDDAAVARFGHASTAEQVEGAIDSAM